MRKKKFKLKLGWIATLCALFGQLFIIFKNPLAFVFWSIGEGLLMGLSIKRKEWGETAFFTIYLITNIIALVVW